jgi:hypothetical protein
MAGRRLQQIIPSVATSDGAGVSLRRSLGRGPDARVDPFLMLDEFSSEDPNDYIAGFPSHPHRGFETVTYMLDGHMLHEDHLGNRGDLLPGGAQWMTAGRGIIHSEMPQQESGRLRGFQLWINLPAAEKMKPASYCDIRPDEIPTAALPGGGEARVIAGRMAVNGRSVAGRYRASPPNRCISMCACRPVAVLFKPSPTAIAPLSMPTRASSPSATPRANPETCRPRPPVSLAARVRSKSAPQTAPSASCCWRPARWANRWCSTGPSS